MSNPVGFGKHLNDNQRKAAATDEKPVLVIAGAGTGKTSVVVERICRLLGGGTPAKRLLALTFTEKAAAEMIDRVNQAVGSYEAELPILTFNAYGESLLRRFGADIGLGRNFTVMGDSAQIVFLRERIDELGLDYFAPLSAPDSLLGDVAAYFSLLKQNVITPADYSGYVKQLPSGDEADRLELKKQTELAAAYETYIRLCRQANVIDYDDQIYLMIDLFRQRPNILREVQSSYDFVMVDEFQDTNVMQSVFVDMVAAPKNNLFVVGDDDQSIYGWRGATLANILDFKDRYPEAKEITLTENYRSTKQILDSAYRLIQHNNPHRLEDKLNINKRLTTKKSGAPPATYEFETLDQELTWIAEDIKRRLEAGMAPGDIAVMARRNQTIRLLHNHLEYAGIDHVVAGERFDLYSHPAVRMLLEALRSVADPLDNTSLYHTLCGPLFGVPARLLSDVASRVRRQHESLEAAIDSSNDHQMKPAKDAVRQLRAWREKSAALTVVQLSYEIVKSSGYLDGLSKQADKSAAAVAGTRIAELFNTMQEFEQIAIVPSLTQYIQALPALQAAGEGVEDNTLDLSGSAVNLLTVHKSKGLEWPIVYIADCTEGSFPLRLNPRGLRLPDGLRALHSSQADEHMAEERRLMYVAMTRARDELILTHSNRHRGTSSRKPSRFLGEAFGDHQPQLQAPDGDPAKHAIGFFGIDNHPESDIPIAMLKDDHVHLSVSQVSKYLDCPLDFYYCHVLNVPTPPSSVLSYGSLIHGLIEDMNRSLMAGKLKPLGEMNKRLEAAWPRAGYLSPKHRDRAYNQAKATLGLIHRRLAEDGRVPLAVEEPFAFSLKEAGISVSGRFDAVLPYGDSVEIVDYKTSSNVDTPDKAKSRARGSAQLTYYALAWLLTRDEMPALVTLDFVETGQKGSVKKTSRGLDTALDKLRAAADGIRNKDFPPGRDHRYCIHPPV